VQWSPPAFAQTKTAVKPTAAARWHVHPVNSAAGSWRCRASGVGRGAENGRHRLAARPSKAESTIMTSEQFREPLADHREGQFEGQNGAGATVRRPARFTLPAPGHQTAITVGLPRERSGRPQAAQQSHDAEPEGPASSSVPTLRSRPRRSPYRTVRFRPRHPDHYLHRLTAACRRLLRRRWRLFGCVLRRATPEGMTCSPSSATLTAKPCQIPRCWHSPVLSTAPSSPIACATSGHCITRR
jgi:hypothetical protein